MAEIIVIAFFLAIGLTIFLTRSYSRRKQAARSYEAWNRSRKMRYY
ncbi:MAG: hypothetical protein K0Q79_2846 [Flavipsychrobacter sp.]|jgi:hypothetical protein|nr:hypothetical protein [Flavipsychrobacter sp.]